MHSNISFWSKGSIGDPFRRQDSKAATNDYFPRQNLAKSAEPQAA